MLNRNRPIAVLIGKVGLDGHDRGAIVLTRALRDEGFAAYYSGIRRTPEQIAELAVKLEADCVGLSSLAGAHLHWFPKVTAALAEANWHGLVIAGGNIPVTDEPALKEYGVHAVFQPHHPVSEIADYLRKSLPLVSSDRKLDDNKVV